MNNYSAVANPPVVAGLRTDLPTYQWGKKKGAAPTPTFRRWLLIDWAEVRAEAAK